MKIVHAASEAVPYAKTGGLADVVSALSEQQARNGHDVTRILPLYRCARAAASDLKDTGIRLRVPVDHLMLPAEIWRDEGQGTGPETLFVRCDELFDRSELYGDSLQAYGDNCCRFAFLQKAIVEWMDYTDARPDLMHCHDWHAALIPLYLQHGIRALGRSGHRPPCVLTVHNVAYQGLFPWHEFGCTNLPDLCRSREILEFHQHVNFLKGGVISANAVTTVSPGHAREICTPEAGHGLDGVFRACGHKLSGILNGVDYSVWNPELDPLIPSHYTAGNPVGKKRCRDGLLVELGLERSEHIPVLGMVSRLTEAKGIDLIAQCIEEIMARNVILIILGKGDANYERLISSWAGRWPGRIAVRTQLDEALAHRIIAGSDLFLMPSRFEPCGLSQLYAMRYGTLPVVHATGGLRDSVTHSDQADGTGFLFYEFSARALLATIEHALWTYRHNRARWHMMTQTAMSRDFSWKHAAQIYTELYDQVCASASP